MNNNHWTLHYKYVPYLWYSISFRDLSNVDCNYANHSPRKLRKPFNKRNPKSKKRESNGVFHSNEKVNTVDSKEINRLRDIDACENALKFKYKQNPRNRAKARWSKGGDSYIKRIELVNNKPYAGIYIEDISIHNHCANSQRNGMVWSADAHQYAYLKYSLCTKGVDGITGWIDCGGKWMKRKLSKHERRNGKVEVRRQLEDLNPSMDGEFINSIPE